MRKSPGYSSDNPGHAKGSATSKAGSVSMIGIAVTIAQEVYCAIADAGRYGCTADEAAEKVQLPNPYSSRPRIAELQQERKIVDSGRTRRNRSGRMATVWVLPEYKIPAAAPKDADAV